MYFIETGIRVVDMQPIIIPDFLVPTDFIVNGTYEMFDDEYYELEPNYVAPVDVNTVNSSEIIVARLHEFTAVGSVITVDENDKGVLSGTVKEYFAIMTPILEDEISTGIFTAHNSLGGYLISERNILTQYYEDLLEIDSEVTRIWSYDDIVSVVLENE